VKLLLLYGPPAVGKLTVARELSTLTGFPIFHNHLVVDALLAVFPFGSPEFIKLREKFWLEVLTEAASAHLPGVIFTFAPESTVSESFVGHLVERLEGLGTPVSLVSLNATDQVIEDRVSGESRRQHGKIHQPDRYRELRAAGAFAYPPITPHLEVDTSLLSPAESAARIAAGLGLATSSSGDNHNTGSRP
jgi:chloramphenicol 3-O-phosphotransferase